jgi:uncharacterized protein (DUF849 family)
MKTENPAVPYTPGEIAQAAVESWRAGAAVVHIHVRDPQSGAPSSDIALFQEVVERIREACDVIINLTTSGLNITGESDAIITERRLEPVSLRPEICSLDVGSMNFADRPFVNSPYFGQTAAQRMRDAGVKPEIEVFDVGHIAQAKALIRQGLVAAPAYFQLCMGVPWGIPASPENLIFMQKQLPADCVWSVLGVGRHQLPMITLAALLGGHVRVGFEDNLYRRKDELARDNAHLVEMAVQMLRAQDKEPATPDEARQLLGLG